MTTYGYIRRIELLWNNRWLRVMIEFGYNLHRHRVYVSDSISIYGGRFIEEISRGVSVVSPSSRDRSSEWVSSPVAYNRSGGQKNRQRVTDLLVGLLASALGPSLLTQSVGVSSLFLLILLISRRLTPSNHPRLAVFDDTPYLSMCSL